MAEPEPEAVEPKAKPMDFRNARQQSLWEEQSKVIEFPRAEPVKKTEIPRAVRPDAKRPKRAAPKRSLDDTQPCLDFSLPPQNSPRTLKTSVEAVIYCDYSAAAPVHRALASAVDIAVILAAGLVFGATIVLGGGELEATPMTYAVMALAVALIGLFYGVLYALADGETLGRQSTGLRTVNFDGQRIGRKVRLMRLAAAQISIFSAALGLLWSMLDEENLTWHDHMMRSFPTCGE